MLIETYGGRVRSRLRQEFGTQLASADLDGVLNRAVFQVWKHAAKYKETRGSLGAWFYVIAHNTAISLVRKERKNGFEDVDTATLRPDQMTPFGPGGASVSAAEGKNGADPVAATTTDPYLVAFEECIAALPPMQGRIIRADLRTGEPVSAAQLAEELGTSTNSVYVTRSNARKAIKAAMQARGFFREKETGAEA